MTKNAQFGNQLKSRTQKTLEAEGIRLMVTAKNLLMRDLVEYFDF